VIGCLFLFLLESCLAKIHFDPELLPVEAIAGEPPVDPQRLTARSVRQRFAEDSPTWHPEKVDERFLLQFPKLKRAAVLVPLVQRGNDLTVLLTQRTAHLSNHGGQISFPGGRAEEIDSSPIETALRETQEEIGLARRHIEIVGVLPEHVTATGYKVRPVVGIATPPFELAADPNEVAEIFEVPLPFLMNGAHHERRTIELPEGAGRRSFYTMPYERYFIWGATAAMLRNLFHFLRAA
jgi:8-oxo-dGTP pyrophosphatase MutT (NUDIX family)